MISPLGSNKSKYIIHQSPNSSLSLCTRGR
ncbi:hypothetical protein CGRA01v4_10796 [Colletotrichum graminicola]|nr:hypothetical protein CGRA01v4_10796 [Colletotrichum graminicola]